MALFDRFFNRRAVPAYALPLLALLFVGAVVLSGWLFRGLRLDLTQNRQYTLSAGTLHILEGAKQPVKLRLFYSETAARSVRSSACSPSASRSCCWKSPSGRRAGSRWK